MGDIGLESPADSTGKTKKLKVDGAQSRAHKPMDPDLAKVVKAWPKLSKPIRRAILALIE
jgi:hypothetical protein